MCSWYPFKRFLFWKKSSQCATCKYLKTSSKSVWSNAFWYEKVNTFWRFIQYTIHWDKTQILKKFPSSKINGTKNALFFFPQAPTHHSFTFNWQFLYKLKHMVHLSTFHSVSFLLNFKFVLNKKHGPFDFKTS